MHTVVLSGEIPYIGSQILGNPGEATSTARFRRYQLQAELFSLDPLLVRKTGRTYFWIHEDFLIRSPLQTALGQTRFRYRSPWTVCFDFSRGNKPNAAYEGPEIALSLLGYPDPSSADSLAVFQLLYSRTPLRSSGLRDDEGPVT